MDLHAQLSNLDLSDLGDFTLDSLPPLPFPSSLTPPLTPAPDPPTHDQQQQQQQQQAHEQGPGASPSEYAQSSISLVLINEPPGTVYKNLAYKFKVALVQANDTLVPFPFYVPGPHGRMVEYGVLTVKIELVYPDLTPVPPKRTVSASRGRASGSLDSARAATETKVIPPVRGGKGIMRNGVADVPLGINALSGRGKSLTMYKLRIYIAEVPQLEILTDPFIVRSKPPPRRSGKRKKAASTSASASVSASVSASASDLSAESGSGPVPMQLGTGAGGSHTGSSGGRSRGTGGFGRGGPGRVGVGSPSAVRSPLTRTGSFARSVRSSSASADAVLAALESFNSLTASEVGPNGLTPPRLLSLIQSSVVAPLVAEVSSLRSALAEQQSVSRSLASRLDNIEAQMQRSGT